MDTRLIGTFNIPKRNTTTYKELKM